jgi:hypothetical protein
LLCDVKLQLQRGLTRCRCHGAAYWRGGRESASAVLGRRSTWPGSSSRRAFSSHGSNAKRCGVARYLFGCNGP